ncbi:MAG: hypothetical protein ACRENK_16380 [Gemmatimonadaceae bacterium]
MSIPFAVERVADNVKRAIAPLFQREDGASRIREIGLGVLVAGCDMAGLGDAAILRLVQAALEERRPHLEKAREARRMPPEVDEPPTLDEFEVKG